MPSSSYEQFEGQAPTWSCLCLWTVHLSKRVESSGKLPWMTRPRSGICSIYHTSAGLLRLRLYEVTTHG